MSTLKARQTQCKDKERAPLRQCTNVSYCPYVPANARRDTSTQTHTPACGHAPKKARLHDQRQSQSNACVTTPQK
jgi:hypothetical protein